MKINPVMLIVSLAIAALVGYGFWSGTHVLLNTVGAAVSIFATLGALLSIGSKDDSRLSVNIKVIAGVFFALMLIEQVVFAFVKATAPYIIVTGILLLVYFVICYAVSKANK